MVLNTCNKDVSGEKMIQNGGITYRSFDSSQTNLIIDKTDDISIAPRLSFNEIQHRVSLTWKNLTVKAPLDTGMCGNPPQKYKTIINNVSGIVQPGSLLAILGASGAGKSTFLNILTQRNYGNLKVEGEVCLNGYPADDMSSLSAYVQQEDIFLSPLSVEEHLKFQAHLRIPNDVSYEWKMSRVKEVMKEMGLERCKDVHIGVLGSKKGISGGERKRLSFASEVLTNPPLLFCDEPTSGLDSFMAKNVVQILKDMADKGRTIVCTIHQPSSDVFAMFNNVLLMVEGRIAFLGTAEAALTFFEECGYPCPEHFNPADHYILKLTISPRNEQKDKETVETICNQYQKSLHAIAVEKQIAVAMYDKNDLSVTGQNRQKISPFKVSWFRQFYYILWRCVIVMNREKSVFRTRLAQVLIVSTAMGLLFFGQKINQVGITNINGALFFLLINTTIGYSIAVTLTFPQIFDVFRKEHHDGMYKISSYYLASTVAETPHFIILPCLFVTIMYWLIGLYPSFVAYLVTCVVATLQCNVAVAFGYILSTFTNDAHFGVLAAGVGTLFFILVGGFYLNVGSIPIYLKWLQYISWYAYGYEILIVNQWSDVDNIPCDLGNQTDPNSSIGRCLKTGQEVIESFNFSEDNVVYDTLGLCALLLGFRIISFINLYLRSKKTSWKIWKIMSC